VGADSLIVPMNETNKPEVLRIITSKPLENIILIADCTQLLPWCDVRIDTENNKINSIFSLYKDLDFLAGAFWTKSTEDILNLLADYKGEIYDKEMVLICTKEQLEIIRPLAGNMQPIAEHQMIHETCYQLDSWGSAEPRLLKSEDTKELAELYRICGTPAWTSEAMKFGPFFGVKDNNKIVSVAGVHFVTEYGAEIGNVATHPDFRGRGYASECVKSVICAIEDMTPVVVLHYFMDNTPAQRLYENMGFNYSDVDPVYFTKIKFSHDIFS
jgi:ribosomal protein S18 acetylase RimI-like enzyme